MEGLATNCSVKENIGHEEVGSIGHENDGDVHPKTPVTFYYGNGTTERSLRVIDLSCATVDDDDRQDDRPSSSE